MTCKVLHGDCIEKLRELIAKGTQVDSIVTDPPYELGFMGKSWDSTGIAYSTELWNLALQILKPGGHLLAFGGSRTYHRMACAIEDAGFEIRDQIMWIYGQGFPKSLDVSKAIDKRAGAEREVVGYESAVIGRPKTDKWRNSNCIPTAGPFENRGGKLKEVSNPATDHAKQWQGWGTGLKPAHEPIVMARKPLAERSVAENVIHHGTGAINIDGCRIGVNREAERKWDLEPCANTVWDTKSEHGLAFGKKCTKNLGFLDQGRFPANLIHDGSDEVEEEFAKYGIKTSGAHKAGQTRNHSSNTSYAITGLQRASDSGSTGYASRFFYCAKASKRDRDGSKHPTVKPIALMRYLCRLITPPGGTVLDPFAGTGTTGQAAIEEGFQAILIEKEPEYIADISRRMNKVALPLSAFDEVAYG